MEGIDLKSMPLGELWALHETICSILARKLEAEKRSLERRLNELRRPFEKASNETPERRPYSVGSVSYFQYEKRYQEFEPDGR
jgi:hypothetical protein